MIEMFEDVLASMRSNRQRIFLTGFSIGWGMFILVVLLGSASGFKRGLNKTFYLDLGQSISVTSGKTSEDWNGYERGRSIRLKSSDARGIENIGDSHIDRAFPVISRNLQVCYGKNHVNVPVTGCLDGYMNVQYRILKSGRDINRFDLDQKRKVCVINARLSRQLFQDESPIGHEILIDGNYYLVVGTCEAILKQDMSTTAYVPYGTMETIYCPEGYADKIDISVSGLNSAESNEALMKEVHDYLAEIHECSPTDYKGIKISNQYETVLSSIKVIAGIGIFVWIIGIATLIAGIVGVSNIMLISVKERTREIGIRKALGTRNKSIIRLVLTESVLITVIFGSIGLMLAICITQLLNVLLGNVFSMFQNPTVAFWPVIICNVLMIAAGLVAGYIPARRAVSIKLVDALSAV